VKGACARSSRFSSSRPCSTGTSSSSSACTWPPAAPVSAASVSAPHAVAVVAPRAAPAGVPRRAVRRRAVGAGAACRTRACLWPVIDAAMRAYQPGCATWKRTRSGTQRLPDTTSTAKRPCMSHVTQPAGWRRTSGGGPASARRTPAAGGAARLEAGRRARDGRRRSGRRAAPGPHPDQAVRLRGRQRIHAHAAAVRRGRHRRALARAVVAPAVVRALDHAVHDAALRAARARRRSRRARHAVTSR